MNSTFCSPALVLRWVCDEGFGPRADLETTAKIHFSFVQAFEIAQVLPAGAWAGFADKKGPGNDGRVPRQTMKHGYSGCRFYIAGTRLFHLSIALGNLSVPPIP